ncbi:4Fe-4S binding protein [Cytophagales bacterium LB-30]|uniref:4Fe-4S binding protein n=1 Tax=Shiella aurantiaca TaxID=3058365 RepID=A0ABT8F992_9BACT|nr:4Fe-4S binding protein [Shiella aurantiaca]MDN4166997.1 4Fe-4S binding protein [Shiella aurantiaca]
MEIVDDMKNRGSYWQSIGSAWKTLRKGLALTWSHFRKAVRSRKPVGVADASYFDLKEGIVTLQYPHVQIPVPEVGRYKLHNEIDDCIVCDKCAKVCPVDCIEIEPVRAMEEIGQTSDGTSKRIYAATFTIDMAKCCFCGLCTTVCPTECLTMTDTYDFSEYDVEKHVFPFAEMTPLEILEKKQAWEAYQAQKEATKAATASAESSENKAPTAAKPVFKPKMPAPKPAASSPEEKPKDGEEPAKPVFKPKPIMKMPVIKKKEEGDES